MNAIGEGAVIYIRQSVTRRVIGPDGRKTDQLDTVSPELQETAGRDYCRRQGYRVVGVVLDLNRTGRTLKRRKVQEAISYIEAGKAAVIVVWKWSRMSRNRRDWAVTIDHIENKVGGRVESATEPVDTTTAVGRLSRGMLAEIAAFESDRAGEIFREVADGRVAAGLPGNCKPRFGYINTGKGRFEPDPETSEVLATMYRRFIAGDGYISLARWLNDAGWRTVGGGIWREGIVRSVLDSGFGAGVFIHRGKHVQGVHVPVISADEWERYQAVRDQRSTLPMRSRGSRYVLSGLVKCGWCGQGMSVRPDRHGKPWYRCRGRSLTGCSNGYASVAAVEAAVLDWLRGLVDDLDAAAEAARRVQDRVTSHERQAKRLERQIRTQDEALTRLTVDRAHGRVPDEAYDAARDEIVATRQRLVAELEEATRVVRFDRGVDVLAYRGLLAEWTTLPVAHRREMLRQLLARVRVWSAPTVRVVPVPTWEQDEHPTQDEDRPVVPLQPQRGGRAAFTPEQAALVRERHAAGESIYGLAREYGVSTSTVYYLVTGRTYRGV